MCGRYTLTKDKSTIEKHFGPKYYIAQIVNEPGSSGPPLQRPLSL
jgi:putative SOS response-associated peptidase YedK